MTNNREMAVVIQINMIFIKETVDIILKSYIAKLFYKDCNIE